MRVGLPRALAPSDSIDFDIAWAFQVPPDGAPREGTTGDVFMVAYWYPQIAVYDDVTGWQIDPYLGNAEFYMDYADYDVNISLPQGWLVGATGELTNPNDVLSAADARSPRRIEAESTASCTSCASGSRRRTHQGDEYRVRRRAHLALPRAQRARLRLGRVGEVSVGRDGGGRRRSETATDARTRRRSTRSIVPRRARGRGTSRRDYERNVVEFLSSYLWPYPWPQMTALEGPVSCTGMEYPMLTCIGGPRDTLSLYSVQVHETGHMWFPMQVGSDERRFAWQDEGLTRFNQAQGMQAFFKGFDRERISRDAYLALARTDSEVPLMRHGDQYPYGTPAYSMATYDKMATNMVALRALLGDEAFLSSYRTYGLRWLYKHPTQYDFFNSFNSLGGQDLSWFWRTWWYETWTLDQAIGSVTSAADKTDRDDRGPRSGADAGSARDHARRRTASSAGLFPWTCG